jgi:hypothetical protein
MILDNYNLNLKNHINHQNILFYKKCIKIIFSMEIIVLKNYPLILIQLIDHKLNRKYINYNKINFINIKEHLSLDMQNKSYQIKNIIILLNYFNHITNVHIH